VRRGRSGFSLAEALVAAVILGFALMVGLSVVIWADRVERRAALRVAAAELAGSVAERVRVAPYASVASGELDLSGEILADLPEPVVALEVIEDEDTWVRRVGIVVTWGGDMPGMLRLETAIGSAEIYRR
jgi:type II secretory pathway pseudopilin PulG